MILGEKKKGKERKRKGKKIDKAGIRPGREISVTGVTAPVKLVYCSCTTILGQTP
jgi:hypothetical protein